MFYKSSTVLILTLLAIVQVEKCDARFAWEFHCGTWNMQGAQEGGLSSWSRLSGVLGRGANDNEEPISVMAIQESGEAPPYTARFLSDPNVHFMYNMRQNIQPTDSVTEYEWPTGSTSRPGPTYYLYHCSINTQVELDRGTYETQRTNLAIVSLQRADGVRLFRLDTQYRPVLCIRIGTAFFCSFHANVRFNQAPRTIMSMEDAFHSIRQTSGMPISWMIMGDFNRAPINGRNSLLNRLEAVTNGMSRQIAVPAGQTQQSGGILDYAVVGGTDAAPPPIVAERDNRLVSDHTSVRFSQLHLNPNQGQRPDPQAPATSNWLAGIGTTIAVIAGTILSGST